MFGSMVIGIGLMEDMLTVKVTGQDKEDIVYGMADNGNVAAKDGIGEKAGGIDKRMWKYLLRLQWFPALILSSRLKILLISRKDDQSVISKQLGGSCRLNILSFTLDGHDTY